MGKFNVFVKSNYPFFKYYLADDYQNVYIHESLPSLPLITPQLTNSSGSLALVATRVGGNQAGEAFVFKVTATYT
jgi:hypothetical protein